MPKPQIPCTNAKNIPILKPQTHQNNPNPLKWKWGWIWHQYNLFSEMAASLLNLLLSRIQNLPCLHLVCLSYSQRWRMNVSIITSNVLLLVLFLFSSLLSSELQFFRIRFSTIPTNSITPVWSHRMWDITLIWVWCKRTDDIPCKCYRCCKIWKNLKVFNFYTFYNDTYSKNIFQKA